MTKIVGKTDLVREVAEATGQSRKGVEMVFDELLGAIASHVDASSTVNLPGLGRFALKTRPARVARNPRTGEPVDVPASTTVSFRPTKGKS